MTNYKVKTGSGVALVSLVDMTPQPRSNGVEYTRRTVAASGAVYDEGLFIAIKWSMIATVSEYTTLLTQFGLNAATTAAVTIYVPNQFYAFTRYNGLAVRPSPGNDIRRDNYFLRDLEIIVKELALSS